MNTNYGRSSAPLDAPLDDGSTFFREEVGAAIRRHRQACGLTQAKLADAAALSSNYVARLERGELGPSFAVAVRLSRALGVGPSELVVQFRRRLAGKHRAA